ncbi:tetrachloroethene reductive dehalogenase domain protein, putative [Heliomicrobium modesticaldum Ice1]|uniref:Tetrachloroethene reductive dehalogenase domain protein, putative n=1 Tax=Heliobacterium modesticaldum (strain ATCC 51547 / Ice1) TaxID=498761 RepID=B0TD77_HELMI|nr:reductive dehalogenase [Heliomicrobium modesticaldum]ABZ84118.1 tetrachloroethene reductive dehalogenase domain protein, putative [Heliomicrobium modesticaldum Ice1]
MIPRERHHRKDPAHRIDASRYRRFSVEDQAFVTVGMQDTGKKGILHFTEKMFASMMANIYSDVPGKSRLDYAADLGANALNLILGAYGFPNSRFLNWKPLFIPEALHRDKWEASTGDMTRVVKAQARLYGADLVGVARLDPKWVYAKDLEKPFVFEDVDEPSEERDRFVIPASVQTAIVIALAMNRELIEESPATAGSTAASLGYSRMAITAVSLAEFIRSLGYRAIPCMNDTALSIPLAIDAGLGELGRHGLLITPEFGSNVRLCKVLTNMPLLADSPVDFGIARFCRNCLACADHCPSRSISTGEPSFEVACANNNPGVEKWTIDAESCLRFWQENGHSCANCIAVCPFTAGFDFTHCLDCIDCDSGGCGLQEISYLRKKHGYPTRGNDDALAVNNPLTRQGL